MVLAEPDAAGEDAWQAPSLVGREEELALVAPLLSAPAQGRGGLLVRPGPLPERAAARTTASELRIAKLVGAGWSNPDIAAELSPSRRTVQTHVSNILGKLRLHSRLDVVRALAEAEAAGG